MKSIYTVVALLAAIALIGSTGIGACLQQAFAQVCPDVREQFTKLTDDFEKAVLDEAAVDPPEPDKIQTLLDDYNRNFIKIFGLEPPDPDAEPPTPDKC